MVLEPIDDYLALAEELSEQAFLQRHPEPVLVVGSFIMDEQTSTWTRRIDMERGIATPGLSVAPIAKREGSSRFRTMIVVGRSSTSDIRILAGEVSKVHAYLQRSEGKVSLTDAGSTNGTFYRDERLKPNVETVELEPGAELKFGVIPLTYHDASSFYAFLRNLVLD